MLVFRYDKSFEGLLTALFDAYARRTFPDAVAGEGEPLPMFTTETWDVATDRAKADRVWSGLERKLPAEARTMLVHTWLSEVEGSDSLILRYLRKVFDSPEGVYTNFADPDVLEVKQIAQKVAKERLAIVQFVRFQKGGDGTFFAPIAPRYNALPLAIDHFTDRFADQRWLIYDTRRRYGYYYDLEKAVEVTIEDDAHLLGGKLDAHLLAEDEKLFQQMWKSYFKALAIRERINPKLHRQHLPRRFWKYLPEKQ